jgi:hypothetical protein
MADEALALLVQNKLQPQSGFVAGTATEAVVGDLLLFYFMTVDAFVLGHVPKMEQRGWKMQAALTVESWGDVVPG